MSQNDESSFQPQLDDIDEEDEMDQSSTNNIILPTTKDGWLVAPKGKDRKKYRRDVIEVLDDKEVIIESAQTEKCKLVCQKRKLIIQPSIPTSSTANNIGNNTVCFKRFRKNSIISGAKMHSFNQIRFVSLLPQESSHRKELESSQMEYDRTERARDALFIDDGDTRKRNNAGIRSYLVSSQKISRARR